MTIVSENIDPTQVQIEPEQAERMAADSDPQVGRIALDLAKEGLPKGTAFYDPDAKNHWDGVVVSPEGRVTHIICNPQPKTESDWPAAYIGSLPSGHAIELDNILEFGDQPPTLPQFLAAWCKFDPAKSAALIQQLKEESRQQAGEAAAQEVEKQVGKLLGISAVHLATGEDSERKIRRRIKKGIIEIAGKAQEEAGMNRMQNAIFGPQGNAEGQHHLFTYLPAELLTTLARYATQTKTSQPGISGAQNDNLDQDAGRG